MSETFSADNGKGAGKVFKPDQWVERAQAGDQLAFHHLADHYQPEIFRMIYYRTRARMDAEDLTQDVFLKAYKHIDRLESPGLFRSWLYRIAVNRVRDHYRRQKIKSLVGWVSIDEEAFQESEDMAVAPEAADQMERKDFWRRIEKMLDHLSAKEREAFMLRFFDQLSIKEMTTAMGKNESTVKTHLYRALNKIKAALTDTDQLWEEI